MKIVPVDFGYTTGGVFGAQTPGHGMSGRDRAAERGMRSERSLGGACKMIRLSKKGGPQCGSKMKISGGSRRNRRIGG